jgi:hypothetical protein
MLGAPGRGGFAPVAVQQSLKQFILSIRNAADQGGINATSELIAQLGCLRLVPASRKRLFNMISR